jgi:uncharacterized integral membrane protein
MSLKTFIIILITVVITIIFMQNTDEISIKLLAWDIRVTKLMILAVMALLGFLLGFLVGHRGKRKVLHSTPDNHSSPNDESDLDDEDRNYIR